jgi:hypothetical protein
MSDDRLIVEGIINSLKGISGTGRLLAKVSERLTKLMLEPGDYVFGGLSPVNLTAPLAYDLWYLKNDVNLVHHIDATTDSELYVSENLKFLEEKLEGIKPLKAVTYDTLVNYGKETPELAGPPIVTSYWTPDKDFPEKPLPDPDMDLQQLHAYVISLVNWAQAYHEIEEKSLTRFREFKDSWANDGAYFIQVMPFEMKHQEFLFSFDTENIDTDKLAGCLLFPVGQLGVMEVISYFQETWTEEEDFALDDSEDIVKVNDPEMFPPISEIELNKSYGEILIEKGYLIPEDKQDVFEYLQKETGLVVKGYKIDIAPKTWARLWIKNEDVFPVPGEFIGVLIKPVLAPPHVWWFQESVPLLYAGNWMETQNLTSGVITQVTLETSRTDGGVGNEYKVKVNGIEITAYASDFKLYTVNDRVAVLKQWTTANKATRSFTWIDQRDGQHPTKDEKSEEFVILPITFYKES